MDLDKKHSRSEITALRDEFPESEDFVDLSQGGVSSSSQFNEVSSSVKDHYKPLLSNEIIAVAIIKYAALNGCRLPSAATKSAVPDMPLEKWRKFHDAGVFGIRGIEKGVDLTAIKRLYGWNDAQNNVCKDKIRADIARWRESGLPPLPVITPQEAMKKAEKPADLSPEMIGRAMLKYAFFHKGVLPTAQTPDDVPDMPDENWEGLNGRGFEGHRGMPVGMSLPAIKRLYGWSDSLNRVQQDKINADMRAFAKTGVFPLPVISVEEAVTPAQYKDVSPRDVVGVMLGYAALHNGALPEAHIKEPIPEYPELTWSSLNTLCHRGGRNMPVKTSLLDIKILCGWVGSGADSRLGSYKAQLAMDLADYKRDGRLSDDLEQRIERGADARLGRAPLHFEPEI